MINSLSARLHVRKDSNLGLVVKGNETYATPMDNTDFQAQWRGKMVERYTQAALREAAGLDPGVARPRHRVLPLLDPGTAA